MRHLCGFHVPALAYFRIERLDKRLKELAAKKEEMLKQSKSKQSVMDNVRGNVELLIKVGSFFDFADVVADICARRPVMLRKRLMT